MGDSTIALGNAHHINLKKALLRILLYFTVVNICLVILYPYFVMVCNALKSNAEIFSMNGTILPIEAVWSNFVDIWSLAPMGKYMLNSVLIAGGSTAIAMVCGIPAAYALARMKFKGQTAFLGFIIVSQMFAPVVLLIGIYKVMSLFHLTNSILGLVFINAAFNQAFTIWLLRGTFLGISPEMEQAATVDGCNRIQAMFRILLPVAAPGIVTTLIFIFINAWNEYTVALCLISSETLKPLTVGINIFNGYNMIEWQYLFAASLFAIAPVVILFMSIEKNLTSGLTAGGVKG
jgi:multiple sugar transport system permease protein